MSDTIEAKLTTPTLRARLLESPLEALLYDAPIKTLLETQELTVDAIHATEIMAHIGTPPQASGPHELGDHIDTEFGDKPYDDGYVVTWDGDEGAFILAPPGGSGGPLSFLELTDTPNSYTGQDGKVVMVDGNALVFGDGVPGPQGIPGQDGSDGQDGEDGEDGLTAYQLAVNEGFVGTLPQWLESLHGEDGEDGTDGIDGSDGAPGLTAYEIAVLEGFEGTITEWLLSLQGAPGEDGEDGTDGTNGTDGVDGEDGLSAYEVALANGFVGTEEEWLLSLKGDPGEDGTDGEDGSDGAPGAPGSDGADGLSAYEIAVLEGFVGDEATWLASLVGADGIDGARGNFGGDGVQYTFDSLTTNADPGSGDVRFNHATLMSITEIYVSDLNVFGTDYQLWFSFLSLGSSGNKVVFRISKLEDNETYIVFYVTSIVDEVGYFRIIGGPLVAEGTFAAGDQLIISESKVGDKGNTGNTGATGATGAQGGFGGNSIEYLYSNSVTDADPSSGFLKFDNVTPGSVTQLFIDDNDANGVDVQAWLGTLDDSTSTVKGHLLIYKKTNQAVYRLLSVSSTTEATGYWKVAVTPLLNSGSFSSSDPIVVTFSRTGDAGNAGDIATAVDGSTEQMIMEATNKIPLVDVDSGLILKWISWLNFLSSLVATALTWTALQTFNGGIFAALVNFGGASISQSYSNVAVTSGQTWTIDVTNASARALIVVNIELTIGTNAANTWAVISRRVTFRADATVGNNAAVLTNTDLGSGAGSSITVTGPTAIPNGIRFTLAATANTTAGYNYARIQVTGRQTNLTISSSVV